MEKDMINTPEGMEILDTSVPGIEKVLTEDKVGTEDVSTIVTGLSIE